MKQKRKQNIPTNAFIGPSEQILAEIGQDILDVQRCLDTNAAIVKNYVKGAKQNKINRLRNENPKELKHITQELSEPQNWNKFKKRATETSESIQRNTTKELKEASGHINRLAKSTIQKSSEAMYQGGDIISEKTPKASNLINKSLRGLFSKKKSLNQRDLELLEKMAELRQEGILSPKEFALKKRQILEKL